MTDSTNNPNPCGGCDHQACQCSSCHHLSASINTRIEAIEKNVATMSASVTDMSAAVVRLTNAMVGDELMGNPGYGKRLSAVETDMASQKAFKTKVIAWAGAISATTSAVVAFVVKVLSPLLGSGKG